MINIFFKTDSLLTRKIAFCIDYVINSNVDKLVLLDENHSIEEYWINQIDNEVCFYETFENSISDDDLLFTSNENINEQNVIVFENPYSEIKKKKIENKIFGKDYPTKPMIIILSFGLFPDTYCLEILLNKIINENNIVPFQKFSDETKYILNKFKSKNLLNDKIENDINKADVIIQHINSNEFKSYIDLLYNLSLLSPNYIYICADRKFNNYDLVEYIKKLVCNNCYVFSSPYLIYEIVKNNNVPVYDFTYNISIFNKDVQKNIETEIIDKFYIPKGIRPIK